MAGSGVAVGIGVAFGSFVTFVVVLTVVDVRVVDVVVFLEEVRLPKIAARTMMMRIQVRQPHPLPFFFVCRACVGVGVVRTGGSS